MKKMTVGLIIVGVSFAAGVGYVFWQKRQTPAPEFRSVSVSRGTIQVNILATGVVQPENRLEIKPPIAGRAEKVLVAEGQVIRKGQILAWMSSTERAALLDAARARGPEELSKWEKYYNATPVLAPINGTIISRNIEPGQTFTNQESILVMSDRLTVKAQVDETDISQIKLKQTAGIVLDAYPDKEIPAIVDQIAYDAKTVNNVTTYLVDTLPDTAPEYMRSGMTANVTFKIEKRENVLFVPAEAVKFREGQKYVLAPGAKGEARPIEVEVKTGITDGKKVEITEGLNEGELVFVPQLKSKNDKAAGGASPFSPMGGRRPH